MGDQQISPLTSEGKKEFLRNLLDDISALEVMIADGLIESGKTRIGAEQEYCLVGPDLRPAMTGPDILPTIGDPHFTSELASWNLEINLDPQDFGKGCLDRMAGQLDELLTKAQSAATAFDSSVVLTGILPTIRKSDLDFNNMTPNPRYHVLDNILKELRGEEFALNIEGVDELSVKTDSILYEACNTSFQVHLQIEPTDFVDMYNWSQVLAGPVLSSCVNSPLLLGKELWMETRIALFRQSLDVRHAGNYIRDKQPRVAFGFDWLKESVLEIFKADIALYRLLISSEVEENSLDMVRRGEIPELRAMNLHNGTLYKWNRPCYGIGGGVPHLRIENRYIPAGPTPHDEMANLVFWTGLMLAMPDDCRGQWERHFHFKEVRHNFLKAAQHGLSNQFTWFGESKTATRLILDDLLPLVADRLSALGIPGREYSPYLESIELRVKKQKTGADWIIRSLRGLQDKNSISESVLLITQYMKEQAAENMPVHEWSSPRQTTLVTIPDRYQRVDSVMTSRVICVREDDLIDFAKSLLKWYDLRRLPVENIKGQVRGVITQKDLDRVEQQLGRDSLVREYMTTDVLTVAPEMSLAAAEKIMRASEIGSLPVVRDDRVIGIITDDDIRWAREKSGPSNAT